MLLSFHLNVKKNVIYIWHLFLRQPRWCSANHGAYSTSVVMTSDDEGTGAGGGGRRELVTYCKRHPVTNLRPDAMELVQMSGEQTYGAMWKAPPPPSYTSPCTASSPCNISPCNRATPPAPQDPDIASAELHLIRVGVNPDSPLSGVDVVKGTPSGTSTLTSFRPPPATCLHDYEAPSFVAMSDGTLRCRPSDVSHSYTASLPITTPMINHVS